jgi:thymidylate kinase
MYKLIVFTGLDGSGTSSIAEDISKRDKGSLLIHTPTEPYKQIRPFIDDHILQLSKEAHYFFYLSSVIYASTIIENHLQYGNVYCVRYLIDTIVSHRTHGLNVDLIYDTKEYHIRKPDLTFYLDIDESTRQDRISKRGKGILDQKLDDDSFRQKFLAEFDRYNNHFIKVSNDNGVIHTSNVIFEMIKQHL